MCLRVTLDVLLGSWLDYSLKYEISGESSSSIAESRSCESELSRILGENSRREFSRGEGNNSIRSLYLLTRIPVFRIDVDYYSTFKEAEWPHLGIRLLQVVEVLHDLIVVHTQIKVIERHRFLLLLGWGWGARGARGGWGGRGGRWRRRRRCCGGRGRAASRSRWVHSRDDGGYYGGSGERRVHRITDYGRPLDLPGSSGVLHEVSIVVVIHQLHEFLLLAVLLVCVVRSSFPVRLDYMMIRLLRCFAVMPMIIPMMAAATTTGRPVAMFSRRIR